MYYRKLNGKHFMHFQLNNFLFSYIKLCLSVFFLFEVNLIELFFSNCVTLKTSFDNSNVKKEKH